MGNVFSIKDIKYQAIMFDFRGGYRTEYKGCTSIKEVWSKIKKDNIFWANFPIKMVIEDKTGKELLDISEKELKVIDYKYIPILVDMAKSKNYLFLKGKTIRYIEEHLKKASDAEDEYWSNC